MDFIANIAFDQIVWPLVGLAITAILGWVASIYTRLTGKQLEANNRSALQSALENGVRLGLQFLVKKYGINVNIADLSDVQKNEATGIAAGYVQKSVPDAVAKFGLDFSRLQELAQPKLPVLTPDEASKLSSTGTVVTKEEALKNG